MILAITPNLAWDVTYHVDRLEPGRSHRVREVNHQAGGKGVNLARVAHALGHRVHVLSLAGGITGDAAAADLAAAKIPATWVPIRGTTRQSVTVVPRHDDGDDDGDPSVFNEPGPAVTGDEWAHLVQSATAQVRGSDVEVVTVSGSLPAGVGEEQIGELLHALDVPVYADTSGPALRWVAAAGAALLAPNRSELAEATGTDDLATGVQDLLTLGAGAVVVTDGAAGMMAVDPGATHRTHRARVPHPVSGNPTGAGDAALGALAMNHRESWPVRLSEAVAVSAAAVTEPVAGVVRPDTVRSMLEQVLVERVEGP